MMRNLDECRAEVFRRSEKRILQRKRRRKQLLAVCIPLALVSTLLAARYLPPAEPEQPEKGEVSVALRGEEETKPTYELPTGLPQASVTCAVEQILVTGADTEQSYTAVVQITQICDQLKEYAMPAPESNGAIPQTTMVGAAGLQEDKMKDYTNYSSPGGYTITLVYADGSKEVFWLADNVLTDQTRGESFTLTKKQLEELEALLGISQ